MNRRTSCLRWCWVLLTLCGACAPQADTQNADTEIRLALNWFPDAQHAGFYGADVYGYFEREHLRVRIIPGGPAVPTVQQVSLKQVDFAVANADQILMARAQGAPVVAVLASMQSSPRCIMVHRQSGIESLQELRDVTLGLGAGKAFARFLQQELPLTNVKVVPYTGSVAMFLEDQKFAQQAYVFSEPYVVRQKGADPVTLMVSDLGFNPYSSCLMTHEDLIRTNPEQVRRVVRCVREGWLEYFRDPQRVHEKILSVNPQMDAASLEFGMQALAPLCLPPGADEAVVGSMSTERWQTLGDQLIKLGFLPAGSDVSHAFTNEFIEPRATTPSAAASVLAVP